MGSDSLSILFRLSRFAFEVAIRLLFRMRIVGRDNLPEPPFIVASNHTSLLDPPLVGVVCKKYLVDFVVKQELFEFPVIGEWTKRVRCVPVRRGDNSIKGLRETLRRIKAGHVVGIFPEGTRSIDGSLQEAKTGTGFLMAMARVPVVPVYVFGSSTAFPKGRGIKLGAEVGAIVGKPMYPDEFLIKTVSGKPDYAAIGNMLMERISQLKESYED
ncbi:MAG: lysophospholipid acyltransferase family protein [Candidatus Omnitrophota bacterium]